MQDSIKQLKEDVASLVATAENLETINQIKIKYLGKSGVVTGLLKNLGDLPADQRPIQGAAINQVKQQIQALLNERQELLASQLMDEQLASDSIDVTLPGRGQLLGSLHPISRVRKRAVDLLVSMGFEVADGPEIEGEFHNFTALNVPEHHPARASQDTFYFEDGSHLLRTHTSSVQIRVMQENQPPLRIITPGKVYRCDSDQTHTPMFHQIEGLVVNDSCQFSNLKYLLQEFINQFFETDVKLRFRPSYFPFTEPSAEVDIEWGSITGAKRDQNQWLEVLGCGMVHPNVFSHVNIDPDQFRGYAFGVGLDRLAMLRYNIKDLRSFFENDLQFLSQF